MANKQKTWFKISENLCKSGRQTIQGKVKCKTMTHKTLACTHYALLFVIFYLYYIMHWINNACVFKTDSNFTNFVKRCHIKDTHVAIKHLVYHDKSNTTNKQIRQMEPGTILSRKYVCGACIVMYVTLFLSCLLPCRITWSIPPCHSLVLLTISYCCLWNMTFSL